MPAETPGTSSALPYPLLMSIQQGTMEYRYRCIPTLKNPFDIAIYPLLLEEARPRTLIEIGSHKGGSALWFADMSANLGFAMHVYSVDLATLTAVSHRLEQLSSLALGAQSDLGCPLDHLAVLGLAGVLLHPPRPCRGCP